MAWRKVDSYYLGFSLAKKQFSFYYQFAGDGTVNQLLCTPDEFQALADMFRNEGPINYNTDGGYFVTAPEPIGEGES